MSDGYGVCSNESIANEYKRELISKTILSMVQFVIELSVCVSVCVIIYKNINRPFLTHLC